MSSPPWLPFRPLPLRPEEGREAPVARGCQQCQWDICIHHLTRTFCTHTSQCAWYPPLLPSPPTSSGRFRTPVAPLGRANGMAGLLALQRGCHKDGGAESQGWLFNRFWSERRGWQVALWSLAHVAVSFHFSSKCPATSFPPFPSPDLLCLSLSCVHCMSVSPAFYLNPPPPPTLLLRCHAFRVFHYVALVCLCW